MILGSSRSDMTSGDLADFQTQLQAEVANVLQVSTDWITILSVTTSEHSTSVSVGLDSQSFVIGSNENQQMANNLSDSVTDPTNAVHLAILYPLMAGSTVDSPSSGHSSLFYVEVALGSVAGVVALVLLSWLCGRMYRHYRDDKEAKWNTSSQTNPVHGAPATIMSNDKSVELPTSHDHGGLNVDSYGYTNPVANRSKPVAISTSAVTGATPTPQSPHSPTQYHGSGANRPGPPVPYRAGSNV